MTQLLTVLSNLGQVSQVNAVNDSRNTPLHWAVVNGHMNIVKILCEHGADPFIKNEAGHDAFYEAELNQKEEIIDYLLVKYPIEPSNEGEGDEEVPSQEN